jgi:hypothetical protein
MNAHNSPNRIPPFTRLAKALGEDEPITLEKDIRTLCKDEMRILDLALGDRAKALLEWAHELKSMGHIETFNTIMVERGKTIDLRDLINDCWQVDLIPED